MKTQSKTVFPFLVAAFVFASASFANEGFREIKGFNPVDSMKSDQAGRCVIRLVRANLEKLGAVSEKLTVKDVTFENIFTFETKVKGSHPFNSQKREAYRRDRMMRFGRYWNGLANGSLYSVPVVLEKKEGAVSLQAFVRAFWDGNNECKLQFPEKKKGGLVPDVVELIKNLGKKDDLDALFLADLDHNIYFFVDSEKSGFLNKKYTLE